MAIVFPRTNVGGVSVSRMIIGTNWILGYSHTSPAADSLIKHRNCSAQAISKMLETFLQSGVDTIMGPFAGNDILIDAVKMAEDNTGKGMILVDTPIINVDDNADARKEAEAVIALSKKMALHFASLTIHLQSS